MILLASTIHHAPIMGLQTGTQLAKATRALIDPGTLSIVAYTLEGPLLNQRDTMLRVADIRELSDVGMIVDSSDEFIAPGDVVKIDKLRNLNFDLLGMPVIDEMKHKLGKIVDYTLETSGFVIQQLTVRRPLLKSLNDTELVIHRTQIVEINDNAVIVHSTAKSPEPERHEVTGSYVNPFRKNSPAAESIKTNDE